MPKVLKNLELNLSISDIDKFGSLEDIDLNKYHPPAHNLKKIHGISEYSDELYETQDSFSIKEKPLLDSLEKKIIYKNLDKSIINIYISNSYIPLKDFTDFNSLTNYNYTNSVCWNCCHLLDENCIPVPLPIKYDDINKKFICKGIFCSVNCALRYNKTHNSKDCSMLLYYLYKKCYKKSYKDTKFTKFEQAPPKEVLQMFGGILSIQVYRQSFIKFNTYEIYEYPIIFVNREIVENIKEYKTENKMENKINSENTEQIEYRLDRKTKVKKNTINILSMLKLKKEVR